VRNTDEIDLNLLRGFCALYRVRNVSLAAEELGVTQGAMSKALARLRESLADPLFVRTLRGFEPTPFTSAFAPTAIRVLEEIRSAAKHAGGFTPASARRVFRVLMSDIGQGVFLGPIVGRLESEAPEVSIVVATLARRDQYDALRSGDVDLALGHFPHFGRELRQQLLFDERFVCIAARRNPLVRQPLTLEAFAGARHAVVLPWGHDSSYEAGLLARHGVNRRTLVLVPSFLALIEVVTRSDLIATVPSRAAKLAQGRGVTTLPLPFDLPTIPVRVFWHERSQRDAGTVWLRRLVVGLFHLNDRLEQGS
jgi:DNA-binding transcriptional LysR family regulator